MKAVVQVEATADERFLREDKGEAFRERQPTRPPKEGWWAVGVWPCRACLPG